jgi:prepilin-type N-terminal cleavage/methylation domain-containing protein
MGKTRGFTLVELAIVLVVIGIIVGAILKGQELIFYAKVKRFASQVKELQTAIYTYYDRYGYLPGDDPKANLRWIVGAGDGNGMISFSPFSPCDEEECLVWQHLRFAGLISGDPNDTNPTTMAPQHPWGGYIYIASGNFLVGSINYRGSWIVLSRFPGDVARVLDRLLDDGKCDSGYMISQLWYVCNGSDYDSNFYYSIWMRIL